MVTAVLPSRRYAAVMTTFAERLVRQEHGHALDAVQARLHVAAAALYGSAGGMVPINRDHLRHLALELRAIALGLDALRHPQD